MKNLFLFLFGLLLFGCSSDIEEFAVSGPSGREATLIGSSGSSTRTQFDQVDGGEIRFLWSAGDFIWANGVRSYETGESGATAGFGFASLPGDAPYEIYYNQTGERNAANIPARQMQAEPYGFDPGANGDFGYAVTDVDGRFTLKHAASYVWFNPWSADVDVNLVSVTLAVADGTLLTGESTFADETLGSRTGVGTVTLCFGETGVTLPTEGNDSRVFAAAVIFPADCSVSEVYVTYTFADGSIFTETKPGKNFVQGKVHRLTTEITKRRGGTLRVDAGTTVQEALVRTDAAPCCLKYGESLHYPLIAEGWVSGVKTISAPAGWTVELGIGKRTLVVAPPEEYAQGMDLGETVAFAGNGATLFSQEFYVLDFTHPEGTFVLIEGNMTTENGTLLYYDQYMREHRNVYEQMNGNEVGNVLQDMYLANGKIYLITQNGKRSSSGTTLNGDGRFVVCDAHTMKRLVAKNFPFYDAHGNSSSECWPQHIVVVSPTRAYIQYSLASMESHSGIRAVDLTTNTIAANDIEGTYGVFTKTGATKARMVVSRGKVFAGRGNSVVVIDPATDAVVKTITYENRQLKDLAKAADGNVYAVFTGEFNSNSGMTGSATFTSPAMVVAFGPGGEVVSENNLPEIVKLRTGTASPTIQICASFTQPYLYFIGTQAFSETKAMRYNYQTGRVNWDYITSDLDADKSGGDIIYGYMGVHPTSEQLWVGKSTYTQSGIHVYDVSRSDAVELTGFNQKKASPAGIDFAYRFSDEWINR